MILSSFLLTYVVSYFNFDPEPLQLGSLKLERALSLLLLLLLSRISCVRPCATLQMAAHQAPLFLGFSKQEYWSGLLFPSPMHETEK